MIFKGKQAEELVGIILESLDETGYYPAMYGAKGYFKNNLETWTAWDNTTKDCWIEDFQTEEEAIKWLNN